ncbi:MAG: SLC26A/SulP transporter family protein, partial [Desulfobacterales bacterium]|nr:SLC26A/SulP transporter family protein [Desulfobacterales bacterium]
VMAGLFSAIFAGFFASLFGGSPIQITGPKAPLTLIYGSLISSIVSIQAIPTYTESTVYIIIGLASFCLLIAGVSQIVFGALGVGNLIKYVPQPVIAGFMTGIAFLLITKQINIIFGLDTGQSLWKVLKQPNLINPLTTVIGVTTIIIIFISKRYIKKIPSSLVAIAGGTGLFYIITATIGHSVDAAIIGKIEAQWPDPLTFFHLLQELARIDFIVVLPKIFMTGLLLGLFASMESLMSSVVEDNLTGTRHDSKKELIGQGIGNIVSAAIGAIPAAGSIPRSIANYHAGGRTRVSGMACGIIIFLIIILFGRFVGRIPLSVIAGIIFVVGLTLIDKGTIKISRNIIISRNYKKEPIKNLSITMVVALITISIDLVTAIIIGILIASVFFIFSISQSIIKRMYHGDNYHSRKRRPLENMRWLENWGREIVVLELQGPLFFGSAENLAMKVEKLMKESTYFIFNFKRVSEIDSTGANILIHLQRRLKENGNYLLFSQLSKNRSLINYLEAMDLTKDLIDQNTYPDTDMALEWTEDHLLDQHEQRKNKPGSTDLSEMIIFKNFSEKELALIQQNMVNLSFNKDETVFKEGDQTRDIYFLIKGKMTVNIYLPESDSQKRLFTYAPGTVIGEMSFLDGAPRSASVWASERSEVMCLPIKNFQRLSQKEPELTTKFIKSLALEISGRLRRTSNQVRLLEDS